jgi:predicted RNA-binding Zn ribbon-like protein
VADISSSEFERAMVVREALRALAIQNAGGSSNAAALATVNAEAKRTGLAISFEDDAVRPRSSAAGFDGFLAGMLAAVAASMIDGSWGRLKACRRDACQWVFFDRSPNGSAAWCDMRICGSREKAKAYYRRRKPSRGRSLPVPASGGDLPMRGLDA